MLAPSPFDEKVRAGNTGRISIGLVALACSLAALIFTIDLLLSLGVASGVPYAAVVLIGMWSRWRPLIFLLAGLGTVLTVLGYAYSPAGGELWAVLANRGLAVFVIWAAAFVALERKRAEARLRDEEDRTRSILTTLVDGVVTIDQRGIVTSLNPAAITMFGYTAEEVIGNNVKMLMTERDQSRHDGYLEQYLKTGKAKIIGYGREVVGRRKDGSTFPLDLGVSESIIGGKAGYKGILREITERKKAENALRHSESQLRLLADSLPILIISLDSDLRFRLANKAYCEAQGRAPVEVVGKDLGEVLGRSAYKKFKPNIDAALAGQSVEIETHYEFGDGIERYVEASYVPELDEQGAVRGLFVMLVDITERKKIDDRLRLHSQVIEQTHDSVVATDRDGYVTVWNKGAKIMFGYGEQEAIGQHISFVYPEDQQEFLKDQIIAPTEKQGWHETEVRMRRKSGAEFFAHLSDSVLTNAAGEPVGRIGLSTDVTDQRKTEEQLRQAQKMEAVGQLTGGVAHDFNNLLTVILGNLDLLRDSVEDNSPARELIDAALKASERSADLTQQLLAFSRKQTLTPKPTDIKERLAGIVGMMERTIGENIDVEINAANGLGRAMVDESQLESAILNLAINARDAMPDGGRVTISARDVSISKKQARENGHLNPGRYIAVDVADTGTGMSDDVTKHAVEPFFTTKEVGQGSGLGLSMVYGFVRQSGGDLKISSKVGRGTTIRLYLPKAKGETKPSYGPRLTEQGSQAGKETVLVVEDEPQVRSFIVTVLERLGYNVLDAETGSRAIAVVEKASGIDLLITDLVLPGGMNGHEIAQQVKRLNARTRIVYISGYSRGAIESGDPNSFLMKPFGRKALAETVRKALDAADD